MGNNSYLRTDSIGAGSGRYDLNRLSSGPYKYTGNIDFSNINYSAGYCSSNSLGLSSSVTTPVVKNRYALSNASASGQSVSDLKGTLEFHIANIKSLEQLINNENLSEASKVKIRGFIATAKNLENCVKNNATSSIVLSGLLETAADLDKRAAELFTTCQDEIASATNTNPDATTTATDNESDTAPVEGDTELSAADKQARYGVPAENPITVDYNAAALASGICDEVDSWSDDSSREAFKKYFGDDAVPGKVTANNVIQVLAEIAKIDMVEFVEDVQDQDTAEASASMIQLTKLISAHVEILVGSGLLSKTSDDYKTVTACIQKIGADLADFDANQADVATQLTTITNTLYKYGEADYLSTLVKEKQAKEEQDATNKFVKAYVTVSNNAGNSLTFDDSKNYTLPSEIQYLPNEQAFQVTIEGKKFKGKDFAELNRKVMRSGDDNIIDKWISIKKDLLNGGSGGSTSATAVADSDAEALLGD